MGSPSWADALRASPSGVILDVEVVPNADRTEFPAGYDPWRKRLKARVAAPRDRGRANDELRRAVAAFFQVPADGVRIVTGSTSRHKRLTVDGMTSKAALARIEEALRGP